MMTISQVRHRVIQNTGDGYYETVKQLKEDLEFFSIYISRNKKTRLGFTLIPFAGGAFRCYKDVYGAYGYYPDCIENTYCICSLMDSIITDIYHESNGYTEEEIVDFAEFLKDEIGLKLEDYVSDFIGCSHGVASVRKKLCEILYGEEIQNDKDCTYL